MKVNLKRNWYGPGDVRFRKAGNPHDFSQRLLAVAPKDAMVEVEEGVWISVGEWRKNNSVKVPLPVPQPFIYDETKRPILGSGKRPVEDDNPGRAADLGRANEVAATEANEKAEAFRKQLLEEQAAEDEKPAVRQRAKK